VLEEFVQAFAGVLEFVQAFAEVLEEFVQALE
jgi:hypothetical protein